MRPKIRLLRELWWWRQQIRDICKPIWRKLRAVLLWHPLGRPVQLQPNRRHPRMRKIAWAIAYRLALSPILLAAACVMFLVLLTHPPRQALSALPGQYALTCRDVEFLSDDGVELQGWYINSFSADKALSNGDWKEGRPAVVLCHGYGAARDQLLYPIGRDLVRAGYDVLLMDFRGHGQSGDAPVSFGTTEAADVTAAVRYLSQQPGVDGDRIGLLGSGMGAFAAILSAPRCPGVQCVVAVDTYPSVPTTLRRTVKRLRAPAAMGSAIGWGMSLYFGHRLLDDSAVTTTQAFGDRGLLLITGQRNTRMPASDLEPIIHVGNPNAARMIVPNAGHGQALFQPKTAAMVVQYFDAFLARKDSPDKVVIPPQ